MYRNLRNILGPAYQNRNIIILDQIDSTNNYAKQLALNGAPSGTIVLSKAQHSGKGRLGRSFSSPDGLGIYFSIILRFSHSPLSLLPLTPLMAEAARRAIAATTGLSPKIKWINDLVFHGRKLCGILTEQILCGGYSSHIIVGIGINCNQTVADFSLDLQEIATSLRIALGEPVLIPDLAAELIRQVDLASDAVHSHLDQWMDCYRANCITIGSDVQLIEPNGTCYAHADHVDNRGALWVTLENGKKLPVNSGEVSVRGIYGYTDR